MKIIIPFLISFCFLHLASVSQSYDILNENNEVISGQTLDVYTNINQSIEFKYRIRNNTENSLNTKISKKYIQKVDESSDFFCIPSGACVLPTTMVLVNPFQLEPNVTTNMLTLYYQPGPNEGTTTIEYTIFNDDNPEDAVTYTVNFVVPSSNSIPETQMHKISVYPNPAKNMFYLETTGMGNSIVEVYNVLGTVVAKIQLKNKENKIVIDCSNWNNGVYFARLISDNKTSKIVKILVSK